MKFPPVGKFKAKQLAAADIYICVANRSASNLTRRFLVFGFPTGCCIYGYSATYSGTTL